MTKKKTNFTPLIATLVCVAGSSLLTYSYTHFVDQQNADDAATAHQRDQQTKFVQELKAIDGDYRKDVADETSKAFKELKINAHKEGDSWQVLFNNDKTAFTALDDKGQKTQVAMRITQEDGAQFKSVKNILANNDGTVDVFEGGDIPVKNLPTRMQKLDTNLDFISVKAYARTNGANRAASAIGVSGPLTATFVPG